MFRDAPKHATEPKHYWPDSLLGSIVKATNEYAAGRLAPEIRRTITRSDLLHFISTIHYMGLVKLPCKHDYFRAGADSVWPIHPSIKITKNVFKYIWRNIHLNFEANEEEDEESEADEEEEEEIVVDDDSDTEPPPVDDRWFAKAAPFVDHVNKISKRLCRHPGFALSIDDGSSYCCQNPSQ
jgi:Transposase IS4